MFNIIKDFEGIIGAIMGVVATMITTQVLRSVGKLQVYIKEFIIIKQNVNNYGFVEDVEIKSINDINGSVKISVNLEIYNTSDICKIMRNIKLGFYNKKVKLFTITPNDYDNQIGESTLQYDEIKVINIESKKCIVKNIFIWITEPDKLELLKTTDSIKFIYINTNNKCKNIEISKSLIK